MLAVVWILSVGIAFIPIFLGWNTSDGQVQNQNSTECVFVVDNLTYSLTIGVGTFFIPLIILYVMYAKILKISYAHIRAIQSQTYLYHDDNSMSHRPRSNSHTHALKQHRATLTLFIIVGAFTACWLPYFSMFTVHPLNMVPSSPFVEEVVLWLGYGNTC